MNNIAVDEAPSTPCIRERLTAIDELLEKALANMGNAFSSVLSPIEPEAAQELPEKLSEIDDTCSSLERKIAALEGIAARSRL